eukprot:6173021-Pleurochrysis_carterae.AAC.2
MGLWAKLKIMIYWYQIVTSASALNSEIVPGVLECIAGRHMIGVRVCHSEPRAHECTPARLSDYACVRRRLVPCLRLLRDLDGPLTPPGVIAPMLSAISSHLRAIPACSAYKHVLCAATDACALRVLAEQVAARSGAASFFLTTRAPRTSAARCVLHA